MLKKLFADYVLKQAISFSHTLNELDDDAKTSAYREGDDIVLKIECHSQKSIQSCFNVSTNIFTGDLILKNKKGGDVLRIGPGNQELRNKHIDVLHASGFDYA